MQEVEELLIKGQRSLNLGNPKEAMKYFTQLLNLDPNHKKGLVKMGNVLGKIGKYHKAISFYDRALELDSTDELALLNKGLAFHFLEKYDDAIECYDIVLGNKPNNTVALYNKSSSLVRQNKIKQGLQVLQQVVKLDYSYKPKAKFDIDFQAIKNLEEFKKLVRL